jgi:cobalt-zinc-cadmium efflux system membrane fusion protein
MNTFARLRGVFFSLCLPLLLLSCGDPPPAGDAHGAAAETEAFERGPHRGRLLRNGDFSLEVTIFETGVPPQFRLYAYQKDAPLPASAVTATITLGRLGGVTDTFAFSPEGDYLVGDGTVLEPHSFDVTVKARHDGRDITWSYPSYEGRTSIAPAIARAAGMSTAQAGPVVIHQSLALAGRVAVNADRRAVVRGRFPGPVKAVRVNAGDSVRAGETLAIVENSETLGTYSVVAPIDGVVLARRTSVGDVAGSQILFEIADLSLLWVELNAFGSDAERVRPGMAVRVTSAGGASATTTLDRILPVADPSSQTVVARVLLPNPDGRWRPGMAVSAEVTVGSREVPLGVKLPALQRFRDFTVVFAQVGDTYEVRMLELGERDHEHVEVLGGLAAGTEYVVEQSFLVKADIEKSGASHDH